MKAFENIKHKWAKLLMISSAGLLVFSACKEEIDTANRFTFTGETVASFLQKNDTLFGQYTELLKNVKQSSKTQSTIATLLSITTNNYTCFAPTNQAINDFLDSAYTKGVFPSNDFLVFLDSVKADKEIADSLAEVIVLNSIISHGNDVKGLEAENFPDDNGTFPLPNLKDRYLTANKETPVGGQTEYYILEDVKVVYKNLKVENGYIHGVNKVVSPATEGVSEIFAGVKNMTLFDQLLQKTGWSDSVSAAHALDQAYDELYLSTDLESEMPDIIAGANQSKSSAYVPEHRKYGFTIFAETDEALNNILRLSSPDELIQKLSDHLYGLWGNGQMEGVTFGTSDEDLRKPDNAINQFVAYHILPVALPSNQLVYHYNEKDYDRKTGRLTIPVFEYYETMSMAGGPRRLLKIYQSRESGGVRLNRKPIMDPETYEEMGTDVEGILVGGQQGLGAVISAVNGYVYPIDELLVYTNEETARKVLKERIRFDCASLVPELINLGYRRPSAKIKGSKDNIYFPRDFKTKNIQRSQYTYFSYLSGVNQNWSNYQGDELTFRGNYDITVKLPPVPYAGIYEIRLAISGNTLRGMCQVYFGAEGETLTPVDIPVDLRMKEDYTNPEKVGLAELNVGWEQETDDQEYNDRVNKALRNKKWMKGPRYYRAHLRTSAGNMAYNLPTVVRKILTEEYMEPNQTYYIRFKSVLENASTDFYFDYMEMVPSEIYNNSQVLEDEW